jgi:type II secretory pathway pseudopilin PulG
MKTKRKKTAFTIVELLTVMSIIIILIGLLLPSLNAVKRFSRVVSQKNQFRNIGTGLQMFESDFDEYPDSDANDADGALYCGAMKLAEVMAGQDGLGFHLHSRLTIDGKDASGTVLYHNITSPYDATELENLRSRKEYLERKDIQICSLKDLYTNPGSTFSEPNNVALLCDVFSSVRTQTTGKKIGMPVLYYRADTSKMSHDVDTPGSPDNIYNYKDNQDFLGLGLPWEPATLPPLYKLLTNPAGQEFYKNTLDKTLEEESGIRRPYNKDSYILISAGWDGIYGTGDDVYNFKD